MASPRVLEDDCEAKEWIEGLTAILAEGSNYFRRIEQSRIVAECHFDLCRIPAARQDVLTCFPEMDSTHAEIPRGFSSQ
jgi:hypothetical protein